MTTIEELKKEKENLFKERGAILTRQKEEIEAVRAAISSELEVVSKKVKIITNQINNMRKPSIASNVREVKASMRL